MNSNKEQNSQVPLKHILPQLKELMSSMGLTQSDLAKKSNLTQPTISRILKKQIDYVRYTTVKQLATALNVSTSELIVTSELVDRWLGDRYGHYLESVRNKITDLHNKNNEKFGDILSHTTHGIDHCKSMENLLHRLIPGDLYKRLQERERFYLLSAAWLHDIGALLIVSNKTLPDNKDSTSKTITNPHIATEQFIMTHFADCGLEEEDSVFMSKLCRYHYRHEDLQECEEEMAVDNINYRLKLLVSYLRLADALDVVPLPPDPSSYAVFLAYDISTNSKLNWIKRNLISGTIIDTEEHRIYVEFSLPDILQVKATRNEKLIREKLDYVINQSMNNLRDDLASVMSVLVRADISYYLDVEMKKIEVRVKDQALPDLINMIINHDFLHSPSASKICQIILVTIANIAGYFLSHDKTFQKYPSKNNTNSEIIQRIYDFINNLEQVFSKRKSCHFGTLRQLDKCKTYLKDAAENTDQFIAKIQMLYTNNEETRISIRNNAGEFFDSKSTPDFSSLIHNKEETFNILLYGFSESIIKALCGFRDQLLLKKYGNTDDDDLHQFYDSLAEKNSFSNAKIFIAEGRPKSQTALNDRLTHHDGLQYVTALGERNFTNIVLIPDIDVGTIIKNNSIHLIMIGANGFNEKEFTHSAGHYSIIACANEFKSRSSCKTPPKVVLVVSSTKGASSGTQDHKEPNNKKEETIEVEGFRIITKLDGNEARDNIWLTRDKFFANNLRNYNISLYNPREDKVPLKHLDYIISDKGFYAINAENDKDTEKNIQNFINTNLKVTSS